MEQSSVFPYDLYPDLVQQLDQRVPAGSHVALLGDARGYLGKLLENGQRTFINIDLASITEPFVETIRADMEEPLPVQRIRKAGQPLTVLTPFSLEYTDTCRSSANIAALLEEGERWVWLCHHSESAIVACLKLQQPVLELLKGTLAQTMDEAAWEELTMILGIRAIGLGVRATKNKPDDAERQLDAVAFYLGCGHTEAALSMGLIGILNHFRQQPPSDGTKRRLQEMVWKLQEDVERDRPVTTWKGREPADLVSLIDTRLRFVEGDVWKLPHAPRPRAMAIIATFEKR